MPGTVYQLDQSHAMIARPLFADATFDRVFVDAFFEARQPGTLFVDDPISPCGAVLCRTYDYFFAGEPVDGLRRFVADAPAESSVFGKIEDLAAAKLAHVIAMYGYVPMTQSWRDALLHDHHGELETIGRRAFAFHAERATELADWYARVPSGFTVVGIDAALAERIDAEIDELIGLFWGGYEAFGNGGFGVCALIADRIASAAYTIAVSDREVNIGIGVAEPFRRRGLATVLAQGCAARAFEMGLQPTWDCDVDNPASADLALKVGFTEKPSFAELAFPGRRGPSRTYGRWTRSVSQVGFSWHPLTALP